MHAPHLLRIERMHPWINSCGMWLHPSRKAFRSWSSLVGKMECAPNVLNPHFLICIQCFVYDNQIRADRFLRWLRPEPWRFPYWIDLVRVRMWRRSALQCGSKGVFFHQFGWHKRRFRISSPVVCIDNVVVAAVMHCQNWTSVRPSTSDSAFSKSSCDSLLRVLTSNSRAV